MPKPMSGRIRSAVIFDARRNAAVFGSGNTVGGHKQGQCAGL